jgi:spore coat polysaccharide biosynthesis protein SpsF
MMLPHTEGSTADLVTNVQVRTFPKGHSVELIKSDTFERIDSLRLSAEEKEHVTRFYYNHPTEFRIINLSSENPSLAEVNYAVDTVDDFHRLEETLRLRDSSATSSSRV